MKAVPSDAADIIEPLLSALNATAPAADVRALSDIVGKSAIACTVAAIARDRDDMVRESAAFLAALSRLWVREGIDPSEVWTELHRRTVVGNLYLQLNQSPPPRMSGRKARPWRVVSSKLP